MKYPKKHDGVNIVTGQDRNHNQDGSKRMAAVNSEDEDNVAEPDMIRGFRYEHAFEQ